MIQIFDNYYKMTSYDDVVKCCRRGNDTIIELGKSSDYEKEKKYTIVKESSTQNQIHITCYMNEKIGDSNEFLIQSLNGSITFTPNEFGWTILGIDEYQEFDVLKSITPLSVPFKDVDGVLRDSGLILLNGQLVSKNDMELPPNTLHLGTNLSISENGGWCENKTLTLGKRYLFLDYENDPIEGSKLPIVGVRGKLIENFVIQPNFEEVIKNVKSISFDTVEDAEIHAIKFKISPDCSPNNIRIAFVINGNEVAHYPSKYSYYTPMDDTGLVLSGDATITLTPHFSFLKEYNQITILIRNDGPEGDIPVDLLGFENLPFAAIDKQVIENKTVMVEGYSDKSVIKYFGENKRINASKSAFNFESLTKDEEGNDVWKPFSQIGPKGSVSKLFRVVDYVEEGKQPYVTTFGVTRKQYIDNESQVINDEMDLPAFEVRALGGAFVPCLNVNDEPVAIMDDGKIKQLAFRSEAIDKLPLRKAVTRNFQNCFNEDGRFRCTDMEDDLPEGYDPGKNDFWADVYHTDDAENVNKVIIYDMRSDRAFSRLGKSGEYPKWKEHTGTEGTWNPKVIEFNNGDNIDVLTSGEQSYISEYVPNMVFSKHPEYDLITTSVIELPVSATYTVVWHVKESPTHAACKYVKVDESTLVTGENKIFLTKGTHNLEVCANGTAFSLDGGDTWKSGSYPSTQIEFQSDGINHTHILDVYGKINPELLHQSENTPIETIKIVVDSSFNVVYMVDNGGLIKSVTNQKNPSFNRLDVKFNRTFINQYLYSAFITAESITQDIIPTNSGELRIVDKSSQGFSADICTYSKAFTTILIQI